MGHVIGIRVLRQGQAYLVLGQEEMVLGQTSGSGGCEFHRRGQQLLEIVQGGIPVRSHRQDGPGLVILGQGRQGIGHCRHGIGHGHHGAGPIHRFG